MICNICPRRCGAERTDTDGKGIEFTDPVEDAVGVKV